jgi:hypothetical protein
MPVLTAQCLVLGTKRSHKLLHTTASNYIVHTSAKALVPLLSAAQHKLLPLLLLLANCTHTKPLSRDTATACSSALHTSHAAAAAAVVAVAAASVGHSVVGGHSRVVLRLQWHHTTRVHLKDVLTSHMVRFHLSLLNHWGLVKPHTVVHCMQQCVCVHVGTACSTKAYRSQQCSCSM